MLAVILDMDGLMLDTEPISLRVWREAALELGYVLDDAVCDRMIGLNVVTNKAMLTEHFGPDFPADALSAMAYERYRVCLDRDGVPHKAGLTDFLQFLDDRAIPRAVATSTGTALARRKLEQAGVLPHFEVIVGGDQVRHGKPAPDIFLAAAARLGVAAGKCVVLEDSGPGVRAAAAAGMTPILIPDGRDPLEETRLAAKFVVDSLRGAQTIIEGMLENASRR